nr:hypothetical protein [Providencia rettgeri]ELR5186751.1 hypothetical protein [Providencia rettgeri]
MSDKEFKEMMYKKPHEMAQCGSPVPATGNLRDQFAMSAMQGDWANQNSEVGYFADCNDEQLVNSAKIYYRMANAMLAARGK